MLPREIRPLTRDQKIGVLSRLLESYSDLALDGLMAIEREICPRCGRHAVRVGTFLPETSNERYRVNLRCKTDGCGWGQIREDATRYHAIRLSSQKDTYPHRCA